MSHVVATIHYYYYYYHYFIIIRKKQITRGRYNTKHFSPSYTCWCRVGFERYGERRLGRRKSPILTLFHPGFFCFPVPGGHIVPPAQNTTEATIDVEYAQQQRKDVYYTEQAENVSVELFIERFCVRPTQTQTKFRKFSRYLSFTLITRLFMIVLSSNSTQ